MTSAPNQARSWVQVGPDWTCVKSRMRTQSSAFPACPQGLAEGRLNALILAPASREAVLTAARFGARLAEAFASRLALPATPAEVFAFDVFGRDNFFLVTCLVTAIGASL